MLMDRFSVFEAMSHVILQTKLDIIGVHNLVVKWIKEFPIGMAQRQALCNVSPDKHLPTNLGRGNHLFKIKPRTQ